MPREFAIKVAVKLYMHNGHVKTLQKRFMSENSCRKGHYVFANCLCIHAKIVGKMTHTNTHAIPKNRNDGSNEVVWKTRQCHNWEPEKGDKSHIALPTCLRYN